MVYFLNKLTSNRFFVSLFFLCLLFDVILFIVDRSEGLVNETEVKTEPNLDRA